MERNLTENKSYLHVIGCGDAFASGARANTCFLVRHQNKTLLLDCGLTTLPRLKFHGYDTDEINGIVITHFHGDHFGGIPSVMLNNEFGSGNSTPFFIASPDGGRNKIQALMENLYPGTSSLLDKHQVQCESYQKNLLKFDNITIEGFPVVHTPETNPHGVKLTIGNLVIAFSGDTSWTENLIEMSASADILILDCNFLIPVKPGHLDYQTLIKNLSRLKAKSIYLTHMGEDVLNSPEISIPRLSDGQIIRLSE